ncbi:MAG: PP2C family protein-serine/threonine phosphatase, partial [Acidobacteria bacterium]|nr:PP2C family protein-serine/threonine phosphatase [Acidobacteriota bacterium]
GRHEELTALVADKTRWLQEANRKLTETQHRIDAEIGLAKTVQQALVPQGSETAGNLTLCSRMTPARELGGDFISIDHRPGGKLFLAVCDVSGKGVAAALFMAVAQSAIAAAAGKHTDVRDIAAEANRTLAGANPLGMFVTGVIAMLDTVTGRVDYVIAGHEAPLAVRPGKPLRRLEKGGNIPLGLDPGEQYDRLEYRIAPNETIVAYTDGVTDACNPEEEIFGEERLQELVAGNALESPEHILQQIWTATNLFSGPMAAADDKTCVLVRRRP